MVRQTDNTAAEGDFKAIQNDFPIRQRMIYLNNASIGPLSNRVVTAVNQFLADVRDNGRNHYPDWCRFADTEIKTNIGNLIGADASEIAFIKNTTEGLNIVANGMDWKTGDKVVVADIEYPSNVYPWLNLKRRGVAIQWLKTENGRIPLETLRAVIDRRTRLVSLSPVQFSNGFRLDLGAVSDLCQEKEVMLNLDAIQYLGALHLDLSQVKVDFLSAGGHKWLLGPIGTGIFYCRRESLETLHPPVVGYHSVDKAEDHMDYDLTFRENAGRFEEALVNFPGLWGLNAAITTIAELGQKRIEDHILRLTRLAMEGLMSKGYIILSPVTEGERSGILSFRHQALSPHQLCERLTAADIHLSVRGAGARLSPGYYNDEEDIQAMLDVLP